MYNQPVRTRRAFLLSAAAAAAVRVAHGNASEAPIGAAAKVRQPAVGQSWRYAKHDFFTGALVDTQLDRVSGVGQTTEIESHSETTQDAPITYPSWGTAWWQKYMGHDRPVGPLTNEIQEPWGMVLVDPHWSELQSYQEPIPLWPKELRPGWSTTVGSYYMIVDSRETMPWQLTMHVHGWESITVPAGHFTALRYFNLIDFRYPNTTGRNAAQRKENIWFAPEIGRWVVRESSGTFRQDVAEEFNESSYRWELLSWT
jgi:hypothetical protein